MQRIAFAGFRHPHIHMLFQQARQLNLDIAGAFEADGRAREDARQALGVSFTHEAYADLLADPAVGLVAVGDTYEARGAMVIAALEAGKHVISDKPLCTSLKELETIQNLAADRHLKIGLMLDLRYSPVAGPVERLVRSGQLGDIQAIFFSGQHPLMYGTRPGWYFEPGQHGGTLNDIAVHGLDLVAWLTGQHIDQVLAARCWNAYAAAVPDFKDCAQFMARLSGGVGLMGDVSYASPDSFGYGLPQYWRFTIWGLKGVLEVAFGTQQIQLALNGETVLRQIPSDATVTGNCLTAFLDDVAGRPVALATDAVLAASRDALRLQAFADGNI
ncbi:MAG: Gfo/Idh/MocA family oxidoreductase [Clostridiaceae bacterium]|jgi:predicted dehydrogenase|nr:Gfo/Idh/MocA family oxidoreductase [Clostridiaceae bacterium]